MEIKTIQGIQETEIFSRQKLSGQAKGGFQQCLDQLSKKNMVQGTTPFASTLLPEIQPIPYLSIETNQTVMMEKANKMLDLIDKYAQELGNPMKTLKEIEPTLSTLKNESEKLYKEYIAGSGDDKTLKEMLNSIQVAANVEYFKFQRGDYI